ncbi:hypothetical protein [Catenulispora rubra]|uniref:hypothetical protein n=1 Tax=Catenulispora rubra TaxID=280293 RepID=UPI0018924427|nr:hypothetical protein [Catenulispora rubra]
MSDDPRDPPEAVDGEDQPLDSVDLAILDDIRALFAAADPVPSGLVARTAFAIDLVGVEDEIARLEPVGLRAAGARGAEESRTITFDSESLTIVVQASPAGATLRVDGWLAPPAVRRVRLRAGEVDFATESDELGRFVVLDVPRGLVQIVVEGEDEDGDGDESADVDGDSDGTGVSRVRQVITPAVVL